MDIVVRDPESGNEPIIINGWTLAHDNYPYRQQYYQVTPDERAKKSFSKWTQEITSMLNMMRIIYGYININPILQKNLVTCNDSTLLITHSLLVLRNEIHHSRCSLKPLLFR